jgi:hypothetical protein
MKLQRRNRKESAAEKRERLREFDARMGLNMARPETISSNLYQPQPFNHGSFGKGSRK